MTRPKCDLCDHAASVHETIVGPAGAGPSERHLCREHGLAFWHAALPPEPERGKSDFRNRVDGFRKNTPRDGY